MSKKLKPLTIFLSDDELVNFKSHFDEFLNMNCDDKIKEQKEEIERLQKENQILMNSMETEAHTKETKEIERLNNIIETFEEELERESNMKEEYTCLEHNTFIDIKNTLKSVLKRFQELKGSDKE